MNFVHCECNGDRAKYLGLIFAIAFCTFLLENQTSISRAFSAYRQSDSRCDRCGCMGDGCETEYFEQTTRGAERHRPDAGTAVSACRMAVSFQRSPSPGLVRRKFRYLYSARPRRRDADRRSAEMLLGSGNGYRERTPSLSTTPATSCSSGRTTGTRRELEMNDHKVKIVGISDASAPF